MLKDDKFCQFIDIPKQTKAYLEELNKTAVDDEDEEEKEVQGPIMNYSSKTEKQICYYLERMENSEKHRYRIVEEFSSFYFSENPKINQDFCLKVMIGSED